MQSFELLLKNLYNDGGCVQNFTLHILHRGDFAVDGGAHAVVQQPHEILLQAGPWLTLEQCKNVVLGRLAARHDKQRPLLRLDKG